MWRRSAIQLLNHHHEALLLTTTITRNNTSRRMIHCTQTSNLLKSTTSSSSSSSPSLSPSSTTHSKIKCYHTYEPSWRKNETPDAPGSRAFADSELDAIVDLFFHHAREDGGGKDEEGSFLCFNGVKKVLGSIGERPNDDTLRDMIEKFDTNSDGKLHLTDFLSASDAVLAGAPARTVLIVGGPGSGKGTLCARLVDECNVMHISCGDLLRDEVTNGSVLGKEVEAIMARGELVSSATIVALVRRRMRNYPGKRVLLDGFPRSLENALEFSEVCGTPELALNLYCDDTILMERILKRAEQNGGSGRVDDNIHSALKRLRTFHKAQGPTLEWLQENHVPVINLDCSGNKESVWQQLLAIGRLMRPATKIQDVDMQQGIIDVFDDRTGVG